MEPGIMPFREKSAWVSLAATIMVYGVYFAMLIPRLAATPGPAEPYFGLLFACVVGLIVLQIVLQAGMAITRPADAIAPIDERERLIVLKSDRVAGIVLSTLAGCLFMIYLAGPGFMANGAMMANAILFALVLAAASKYASQIVYFHRGA
jgi:phage tail protein X